MWTDAATERQGGRVSAIPGPPSFRLLSQPIPTRITSKHIPNQWPVVFDVLLATNCWKSVAYCKNMHTLRWALKFQDTLSGDLTVGPKAICAHLTLSASSSGHTLTRTHTRVSRVWIFRPLVTGHWSVTVARSRSCPTPPWIPPPPRRRPTHPGPACRLRLDRTGSRPTRAAGRQQNGAFRKNRAATCHWVVSFAPCAWPLGCVFHASGIRVTLARGCD